VKDILPFFRGKHYNSDYTLTDKQCADVMAYDALLKERLYPAIQFIWYEMYKSTSKLNAIFIKFTKYKVCLLLFKKSIK